METLYAQTMERVWKLENEQGYEVYAVWEYDFRNQLTKDFELRRMYEECKIPGHLDPRCTVYAAEGRSHSNFTTYSMRMKRYSCRYCEFSIEFRVHN